MSGSYFYSAIKRIPKKNAAIQHLTLFVDVRRLFKIFSNNQIGVLSSNIRCLFLCGNSGGGFKGVLEFSFAD